MFNHKEALDYDDWKTREPVEKSGESDYFGDLIYDGEEIYVNDVHVVKSVNLKRYNDEQIEKMDLVKLSDIIVSITDDDSEIKDLCRILQEALKELTFDKKEIVKLYDLTKFNYGEDD